MFQFLQFCKKKKFFLKWKNFHLSGKISTLHIWAQIWQTLRSRTRKQNFAKVEIFPPKVEKFPPLKIFFGKFFEVENFPPKWTNFHIFHMGCNLANEKVQKPEKKFHQSGKFSTKSGKFSTSAECSNSFDFGKKKLFLEVENFPLKWKKFHFLYSG